MATNAHESPEKTETTPTAATACGPDQPSDDAAQVDPISTPEPLSDERWAEIVRLREAVTHTPWQIGGWDDTIEGTDLHPVAYDVAPPSGPAGGNTRFIIQAPQIVSDLIAEVQRLNQKLVEAEAELESLEERWQEQLALAQLGDEW